MEYLTALLTLAQTTVVTAPPPFEIGREVRILLAAITYAVVGILLLYLGFWIFDMFTPGHARNKIFHEGNIAVAIVMGFFILGLAVVIHGAFSI